MDRDLSSGNRTGKAEPLHSATTSENCGGIPIDDLLELFLSQTFSGETGRPGPELTARIRRLAWQSEGDVSSRDTAAQSDLPEQLGHYRILEHLRSGGMGDVYRARHITLQRDVALKILTSERALMPNSVARFHREMRALATINHPHVVTVYDGDVSEDTMYFAMELIAGIDLKQLMKTSLLTPANCCDLIRQAASGLAAIHAAGIIHRDVKPSNLMLTCDGVVKLVDFGLARVEQEESELTSCRTVLGTESYMSPEQLDGEEQIDHRTDLYSLGRTLQRLLRPWLNAKTKTSAAVAGTIPEPVLRLMSGLLEPDRNLRIASTAAVIDVLAPYCQKIDAAALFTGSNADHWQPTDLRTAASETRRIEAIPVDTALAEDGKPEQRSVFAMLAVLIISIFVAGSLIWFNRPTVSNEGTETAETGFPGVAERTSAEWFIQKGGTVRVYVLRPDAKAVGITSVRELPVERFNVQSVEYWNRKLTPEDLEQIRGLAALESLQITSDEIGDEIFGSFAPQWSLKWLYMTFPRVTDEGVAMLVPYRDSLRSLGLSQSQVTNRTVRLLKSFPLLRELLLAGTRITDDALSELADFPALVSLDVSQTQVTSDGLMVLADCPHLKRLKLSDLPVTDVTLQRLRDLPLTELDLTGTQVSAAAVEAYRVSHPDCRLSH